jgi:hypothetical protein
MIAIDRANLLAGHAVAYATAFLDGRHDADRLLNGAGRLQADLFDLDDPAASEILVPVRLLALAMMRTAIAAQRHDAPGAPPNALARQDRWEQVMASLVELVRHESRELTR